MSTSSVISSIESIPLPPALPQNRRTIIEPKTVKPTKGVLLPFCAQGVDGAPIAETESLMPLPTEPILSERDTVTLPSAPDQPYGFAAFDDPTFHATLSGFVDQAKGQCVELGLTLYDRILPGLQDARRRFAEHQHDAGYLLDGCTGIEEYVKKLGLNPARVRKWRQRDNERQYLREAAVLVGGKQTCADCGHQKGHATTCRHYETPLPPPPENEFEEKLLAEQCRRMTRVLLAPTVMPFPERVAKVVEMAKSVQDAGASGRYDKADFTEKASTAIPPTVPVPEVDPSSLNGLKQSIAGMADVDDIQAAVKKFIDELFHPISDGGLVLTIQVSARREGRQRVDSGDWVESAPKIGAEKRIGRVVDKDKLLRPKIRWFEEGIWQSPKSLYASSWEHPHVLSANEAQDRYPDAIACYCSTDEEIAKSLATLNEEPNRKDIDPQEIAQSQAVTRATDTKTEAERTEIDAPDSPPEGRPNG